MIPVKDLINKIKFDTREKAEDYVLFYLDRVENKLKPIKFREIKRTEGNFLVLERDSEEVEIPMHRIKGTDPLRDTQEKITAIKPVVGMVLDTATGLGYTAIRAAETAEHVVTIELDPVALEVAQHNPWSQGLFDNPKITQIIDDSFDRVAEMKSERFDRIIHDPPAFSLAGDLYSGAFYLQLYRVLRPGGRLFHYIGDPKSKSGRNITAGVVARLQAAGFKTVKRVPRAFGVVGYK